MRSVFARVVASLRALPNWARGVVALVVLLAVATYSLTSGGGSDETVVIPRGDGEETLAANDPKGSPRFALTDDFDPAQNTDGEVPESFETDVDDVLEVESAEMVESGGPYALVWKIENGNDTIDCVNCALLDVRLKRVIQAVIDAGLADDVSEIQGVDPMRTVAGDYSGNGWQVEFVVGSSAAGQQAGERISAWLLENSVEQRVLSVMWQNRIHSAQECSTALLDLSPVEMYPTGIPNSASARRDAAMDRVGVASPSYVPQFEDREGAQFLSGWKATSC